MSLYSTITLDTNPTLGEDLKSYYYEIVASSIFLVVGIVV